MSKLPLHWKWFFGLALLLATLLVVVNVAIDLSLPPYLREKIRLDLQRDAILAREVFMPVLSARPRSPGRLNTLANELARRTGLRVTVIMADGVVVGESEEPPDQIRNMENHLHRPEVQASLRDGIGSAIRHSATIGVDLMYVAVPVVSQTTPGEPLGFVRVALPLHQIEQTTARVRNTVALASLVVGLAAIPFLLWMSRRITRPIQQMSHVAGRVAAGDFTAKAPAHVGGELGQLASALNTMSAQLDARLRELAAEKAELAAILAGMAEGVLVVGPEGRIRLLNEALRRLFQMSDEAIGRTVMEAFRNPALQEFIDEAGRRGGVSSREMEFLNPEERVFEATAASLRGGAGTVAVFHDITRIKKLENIRKEFVANVSHELRTPLSILKGYIETLLDDEPPEPPTARQFLQTIQKNAQRLEALIDDLLTISALESQQIRLLLSAISLQDTARAAIDELAKPAQARSISVSLEIPAQFPAVRADAQRLHQVFSNLLDNAIKYTRPEARVVISAKSKDGEVEVCVADDGPGIAAEHLPRIFERFYRADKARSRELGGTGLGLSIVKHIVQAHGGRVWAESDIGRGSRFFFTLQRA